MVQFVLEIDEAGQYAVKAFEHRPCVYRGCRYADPDTPERNIVKPTYIST